MHLHPLTLEITLKSEVMKFKLVVEGIRVAKVHVASCRWHNYRVFQFK